MIAVIIIAAASGGVVTLDAANYALRHGLVGCLCSKSNKQAQTTGLGLSTEGDAAGVPWLESRLGLDLQPAAADRLHSQRPVL